MQKSVPVQKVRAHLTETIESCESSHVRNLRWLSASDRVLRAIVELLFCTLVGVLQSQSICFRFLTVLSPNPPAGSAADKKSGVSRSARHNEEVSQS